MWLSNPVSLFDFMESPVVDIFSVRTEVLSVQPMAAALNYFSTQSCIHAPQVTLIEFGTCTLVYLLGIVLIISCVSLISDFNHIEISWGGAVAHVRSNKRPVSLYTCLWLWILWGRNLYLAKSLDLKFHGTVVLILKAPLIRNNHRFILLRKEPVIKPYLSIRNQPACEMRVVVTLCSSIILPNVEFGWNIIAYWYDDLCYHYQAVFHE